MIEVDKGNFVIDNLWQNLKYTEDTKEIIFKLIDSDPFDLYFWVIKNIENLFFGWFVLDDIGMKLFDSGHFHEVFFKYFNTRKLWPLFSSKLASKLYDKAWIKAITDIATGFNYYSNDFVSDGFDHVTKTEKDDRKIILAKRVFQSFDKDLLIKLIKDWYWETVLNSDLSDLQDLAKTFIEFDELKEGSKTFIFMEQQLSDSKFIDQLISENVLIHNPHSLLKFILNHLEVSPSRTKLIKYLFSLYKDIFVSDDYSLFWEKGILNWFKTIDSLHIIDQLIEQNISPKSPHSYLTTLLKLWSIINTKDTSLTKFINYLYQKDKQNIDSDSSLVYFLWLFWDDNLFKWFHSQQEFDNISFEKTLLSLIDSLEETEAKREAWRDRYNQLIEKRRKEVEPYNVNEDMFDNQRKSKFWEGIDLQRYVDTLESLYWNFEKNDHLRIRKEVFDRLKKISSAPMYYPNPRYQGSYYSPRKNELIDKIEKFVVEDFSKKN